MTESSNTLMELMNQGGWVMWALFAFSVVSLGTAIQRGLALHRANTDLPVLLGRLREALILKKSVKQALEACDTTPGAVARVGKAALHRFEGSANQLEKSLERHAAAEVRRLSQGLGILATTANVAPLLGFLGTVTGMISSFEALSQFGMSNPGMVALGISEALLTTAAGLMVAVPSQIIYNAFSARVERVTVDIEAMANFVLEIREEELGPPLLERFQLE